MISTTCTVRTTIGLKLPLPFSVPAVKADHSMLIRMPFHPWNVKTVRSIQQPHWWTNTNTNISLRTQTRKEAVLWPGTHGLCVCVCVCVAWYTHTHTHLHTHMWMYPSNMSSEAIVVSLFRRQALQPPSTMKWTRLNAHSDRLVDLSLLHCNWERSALSTEMLLSSWHKNCSIS